QPDARDLLVVDDEGQLVATALGELAERHAEPQPAVALARVVVAAALRRDLRALEQRLDVGAHQRRRDDAEGRQRAVAPADLGVSVEDAAEAVLAGELLERRARIGDGNELGAVARLRPEV